MGQACGGGDGLDGLAFFFQAEDGIRDSPVTGVQTCALPISDYIDGLKIGPGLEYVRKWSPETWPLAFWDRLHLLPQRDFKLLEGEMIRIKTGRPTEIASDRKSRQSRRPYSRGPNSRNSTANPRT